jgi:hypothetical protein
VDDYGGHSKGKSFGAALSDPTEVPARKLSCDAKNGRFESQNVNKQVKNDKLKNVEDGLGVARRQ